jgi:hypothetical protein
MRNTESNSIAEGSAGLALTLGDRQRSHEDVLIRGGQTILQGEDFGAEGPLTSSHPQKRQDVINTANFAEAITIIAPEDQFKE